MVGCIAAKTKWAAGADSAGGPHGSAAEMVAPPPVCRWQQQAQTNNKGVKLKALLHPFRNQTLKPGVLSSAGVSSLHCLLPVRRREAHGWKNPQVYGLLRRAVGWGCRLTFETNGLKAMYFQGVETERFQHRGST